MMQDRFKFRGKRLDNNEWYYGSYLYLHNTDEFDWSGIRHSTKKDVHFIIDENDVNYAVSPETISQCTGLKDKNGKLIYEGDVVKIPDNYDIYGMFAGEVREIYYNEGFRLKPKWDKNSRGNWLEDTEDLEVIGNIHENPELLEVENDDRD